jgi:hypothetical protein
MYLFWIWTDASLIGICSSSPPLHPSPPLSTSGGKSGANFARTADDRFVIKCISRTELQMFLESAPAYFEYMSKAFYHGLVN